MNTDNRVVYLEISSWRGMSIGAQHYYGALVVSNPYQKVELTRKLTKTSAQKLNYQREDDYEYENGYETETFDSEKHVRTTAIRKLHKVFPSAKILLEGRIGYCEPRVVLVGSKTFKEYSKWAIAKCNSLGWYDKGNDDKVDAIYDEWEKRLMKELK